MYDRTFDFSTPQKSRLTQWFADFPNLSLRSSLTLCIVNNLKIIFFINVRLFVIPIKSICDCIEDPVVKNRYVEYQLNNANVTNFLYHSYNIFILRFKKIDQFILLSNVSKNRGQYISE